MTIEEIKLRRLWAQHLLVPSDRHTVVKDLCGLQAQFLSYALHGLSIRTEGVNTDGLVKSWTNRGTIHLFSVDDLPLFLHKGRKHFLRPVDTMNADAYMDTSRKAYFADVIVDGVSHGISEREALKVLCEQAGMSEREGKSIFDPWGGLIRALCENGTLCHKVQEKKAYALCPPFEPMEEEPARLELARRYFTHFGPATIKDAAYFFGTTQTKVKTWLKALPISEILCEDKSYFYIDNCVSAVDIPSCLFLAGFDQLMLGYDKAESLFLPHDHIRDIFTLNGIVRPSILIDGIVAGWWNRKSNKLSVTLFDNHNTDRIAESANKLWPTIKTMEFK
jgi:hypothetical protein